MLDGVVGVVDVVVGMGFAVVVVVVVVGGEDGGGGGGGGGLPGSGGGVVLPLDVVDGVVVLDVPLVVVLDVVLAPGVVVVLWPGIAGASETRSPCTVSPRPDVRPCSAAELVTSVAMVANTVAVASATAPSTAAPGTRWPCRAGAAGSALTCRTPASTPIPGCPDPRPAR
ncbi:hypothetical protein GCM10022247_60820 [Allokutzneria multivorans]|uniref:Uncharacterized protein n=1 Tax=Allokutzneria multivorans TaxID=1142134 RepID=A0ABP7TKL2_9PSEU